MAFLPAVGVIASAAGSVLGGVAQANQANYQAKVARNNANAAQQNAIYTAQASSVRTEQEGLKAAQRLAGVEAGLAANNIDTSSGSAAAVQESQHALGMQDVATVANEGALKVYGYEQERSNYTAQAKADKAQVVPDIVGGVLKGISTVASHAGDLGIGTNSDAPDPVSAFGSDTISNMKEVPIQTSSLASEGSSLPTSYSWMGGHEPEQDWDY